MCRRQRFDGHGPRGTAVSLDFLGGARPGREQERWDIIVASTTSEETALWHGSLTGKSHRADFELRSRSTCVYYYVRITRFAADCRDPVNPIQRVRAC